MNRSKSPVSFSGLFSGESVLSGTTVWEFVVVIAGWLVPGSVVGCDVIWEEFNIGAVRSKEKTDCGTPLSKSLSFTITIEALDVAGAVPVSVTVIEVLTTGLRGCWLETGIENIFVFFWIVGPSTPPTVKEYVQWGSSSSVRNWISSIEGNPVVSMVNDASSSFPGRSSPVG